MELLDIAINIQGKTLPRDHAEALLDALSPHFPWLHTDEKTGIHPIKLVADNGDIATLSKRSRLILRVHSKRLDALQKAQGLVVSVAGHSLQLGEAHGRALLPHSTLYAYRVSIPPTNGNKDAKKEEAAFVADMERELAHLAIRGEIICGLRQYLGFGEVFSMMLHGINAEQSQRLQEQGLGAHRLLGCGIFVPHKSAAAVGS